MKRLLGKFGAWLNRRDVRFLLMAAVMGALLAKIDRAELGQHLRHFDPAFGVAMAGVFLLLIVLFALRWRYIGSALGVRAPFSEFVRTLWITQAVSELGPALVVGELARFQLMRRFGEGWTRAASQAIDRFSGKVVLLLMVAVLIPFYLRLYSAFPVRQVAFFAVLLFSAASLAVLIARWFWPLAGAHAAVVILVCNPFASPGHYGVSLLIQCLLAANLALAALGLGVSRDIATLFLLGPLLLLGVTSLPGLVSDWGKREATAIVVLVPAGFTPEESLAVSLVFGGMHLIVALPGALLLLARRHPLSPRT